MSIGPVTVSVLTPVRGRLDHLGNLLDGLRRAVAGGPRFEFLAAWMGGPDPRALLAAAQGFETRTVTVEGTELPLARARNQLAAAAAGQLLVFLDVDCVPAAGLTAAYAAALTSEDALALGEVRYLGPEGGKDGFLAAAEPHPARAGLFPPPGAVAVDHRHELFWSLSFGVRRRTFRDRIGGFDDGYRGYGIEDTDFAMRAARAGVPLAWVGGALAFHQHHSPTRLRPDGVADLVGNARRYRELWGTWPAPGWFDELAAAGLVRWDPGADLLEAVARSSR